MFMGMSQDAHLQEALFGCMNSGKVSCIPTRILHLQLWPTQVWPSEHCL